MNADAIAGNLPDGLTPQQVRAIARVIVKCETEAKAEAERERDEARKELSETAAALVALRAELLSWMRRVADNPAHGEYYSGRASLAETIIESVEDLTKDLPSLASQHRETVERQRRVVEAAWKASAYDESVAREQARRYREGIPAADFKTHLAPCDLDLFEALAALSSTAGASDE